jgi:hypothetical membrane protein
MKYNLIAVMYLVVAILIAHLFVSQPYVWSENTISQLGAQGYPYSWIMRAGFIGFGTLVILGAAQRIKKSRSLWYRELPLTIYGLGILLSGFFSAEPFRQGVAFSQTEADVHSAVATAAGIGMTIAILLYGLTDKPMFKKFIHGTAFVLVVALSAIFGMLSGEAGITGAGIGGAGIAQRLLYVAGFAWLIYIDIQRDSE